MISTRTPCAAIVLARFMTSAIPCASPEIGLAPGKVQTTSSTATLLKTPSSGFPSNDKNFCALCCFSPSVIDVSYWVEKLRLLRPQPAWDVRAFFDHRTCGCRDHTNGWSQRGAQLLPAAPMALRQAACCGSARNRLDRRRH